MWGITKLSKGRTLPFILITFVFVFLVIIFGCEKKQGSTKETTKQSLPEKVDQLEKDVLRLRMQVNALTSGSTTISTEEKAYSIAQTKFGSFAIICKNVTQFLDGYKVHLSIGNLTSVKFKGAKIYLYWGKDLLYNKELDVTNDFPSGIFTNVEVVMTPAKPEDIKVFGIDLEFNEMTTYEIHK